MKLGVTIGCVVAVLGLSFWAGWKVRDARGAKAVAEAVAETIEARIEVRRVRERQDSVSAEIEAMRETVDSVTAELEVERVVIERTVRDTVVRRVVSQSTDTAAVALIDSLVVDNSRLRSFVERQDSVINTQAALILRQRIQVGLLEEEIAAERRIADALEVRVAELSKPTPWWKSKVATSVYGAAASAVISHVLVN